MMTGFHAYWPASSCVQRNATLSSNNHTQCGAYRHVEVHGVLFKRKSAINEAGPSRKLRHLVASDACAQVAKKTIENQTKSERKRTEKRTKIVKIDARVEVMKR